MKKSIVTLVLALSLVSAAHAAPTAFVCPASSNITAVQFSPEPIDMSLWFAPQVAGATAMGFGLGGSKVGAFVGASSATVNDKPGWMCLYASPHASATEFQKKADQLPAQARSLINNLAAQGINMGVVAYQIQ